MTDERLRVLEQAFRASGDPADLGRWLVEAQRCGIEVDLDPLELAADCGSEAAAFTLGSDRVPGHVVCFRSLCRALRSRRGRVARPARGHLAGSVIRDLEVGSSTQAAAREVLVGELAAWSRDPREPRQRQARCMGLLPRLSGDDPNPAPASKVFVRAYMCALNVMSPNTRASSWGLHNVLSLASCGWIMGSQEMLEAARPQRLAALDRAQRSVEAWAFERVAEALAPRRPARVGERQC